MANPQLSVEITAKIDALRDGFNQAIRETGKWDAATKTALANVDKGFVKLAADVEKSSNSVSKSLAKAAMTTASSGKAIATGANQAGNALTNLGRVAQDAPFGFVGIQNNLNPLLESFQRLRAESGSNANALKALGQSLIGPAGIGIALSLVSSGILLYQQYQQKANKATENAKKVTDDYVKSLDAVTGAQLKGSQNAQKEITDLRLLYNAYQNANLPLKDRQSAYKQLQDQYPSYFGNIKFEETASKKTTDAYNQLTQAIIATARARAAGDKITQNESRKLENEQKIIDLQKDQLSNQKELNKATTRSNSQGLSGGSTGGVSTNVADLTKISSAQQKINENEQLRRNLVTDTNKLTEENGRLVKFVNTQIESGAKITGGFGDGIQKAGDAVKSIVRDTSTVKGGLIGSLIGGDLQGFNADGVIKPIEIAITKVQAAVNSLKGNFGATDEEIGQYIQNTGNSAIEYLKVLEDYNKGLREALGSGALAGLADLGASIGEAFANGASIVDAAAGSILGSIGDILVKFGQLTLAAGIAATALGKALSNPLNPGSAALAIGAGIALIAVGSAVKAFSKNVGSGGDGGSGGGGVRQVRGFATGGYNLPGGMALVGERGPELVNLPTGSSVNNNTKTNRIMADANRGSVNIMGDLEVGLDKLYLRLQATGKKLNRRGLS